MKLTFLLAALVFGTSEMAFAKSYGCVVQSSLSSDVTYSLMIDNQTADQKYAVQSSNKANGTKYRSYYFGISGVLSKNKIDAVVASSGQMGQWLDEAQEKDLWTNVSFKRKGYIKTQRSFLSKRMIGVASLPFIEDGAQLKVSCAEAKDTPNNGCMWCN